MLYMVGDSFSSPNTRIFYNVIDPVSQSSVETLSLDRFTGAGLAAVPEPSGLGVWGASLVGLAVLARRRARTPSA